MTIGVLAAEHKPIPSFGNRHHLALSSFWFGLYFHWQPIISVLIPVQVSMMVGRREQAATAGLIFAAGAMVGAIVPPAVGYFSDHLRTPMGRRMPIILVGTVLNAAALAIMGTAGSVQVLLLGYVVIQVFNNAAGAAYSALIPDVVPPDQYGRSSGYLATMVTLGQVAGLFAALAASKIFGDVRLTYFPIAAILLLTMIPTLWIARTEIGKPHPPPRPKMPLGVAVKEFFGPMASGDFAWVILTRAMITAGVWAIFPFLFFFFRDVVKAPAPDQFQEIWLLVVLGSGIPTGLAGGWVSDRVGRKVFVYWSGALMSLVTVLFIVLYPTAITLVMAMGAVFGLGYGLYYAVDWALACDTVPDKSKSAKDMGLFHVSWTLPQSLVPAAAGPVLQALNNASPNSGYRVVFAAAIVFFTLGTIGVSRVRSVR